MKTIWRRRYVDFIKKKLPFGRGSTLFDIREWNETSNKFQHNYNLLCKLHHVRFSSFLAISFQFYIAVKSLEVIPYVENWIFFTIQNCSGLIDLLSWMSLWVTFGDSSRFASTQFSKSSNISFNFCNLFLSAFDCSNEYSSTFYYCSNEYISSFVVSVLLFSVQYAFNLKSCQRVQLRSRKWIAPWSSWKNIPWS